MSGNPVEQQVRVFASGSVDDSRHLPNERTSARVGGRSLGRLLAAVTVLFVVAVGGFAAVRLRGNSDAPLQPAQTGTVSSSTPGTTVVRREPPQVSLVVVSSQVTGSGGTLEVQVRNDSAVRWIHGIAVQIERLDPNGGWQRAATGILCGGSSPCTDMVQWSTQPGVDPQVALFAPANSSGETMRLVFPSASPTGDYRVVLGVYAEGDSTLYVVIAPFTIAT